MSFARNIAGSYRFGLASSAAAQVAAAKATVAGSVSESAPVVSIRITEPALDLTNGSRISKTSAVNSPAIAYGTPVREIYNPPPAPISDRPPLSGGKALVLGASIGLIFLLGKLGKK